MKKTTTVPIALIIAISFGYIAFSDHNTFTSLFAMFLAMISFAVALGLIWEKEDETYWNSGIASNIHSKEEVNSAFNAVYSNEPTFKQKLKFEEKRIDTVNNYDDFVLHGLPRMKKNVAIVEGSMKNRKVRSDKGVKRK